jgi:hypothetical protein
VLLDLVENMRKRSVFTLYNMEDINTVHQYKNRVSIGRGYFFKKNREYLKWMKKHIIFLSKYAIS